MPAVPKKKHTSQRQGRRRATIKLSTPALMECPHCHQPKRSHRQCPTCGKSK